MIRTIVVCAAFGLSTGATLADSGHGKGRDKGHESGHTSFCPPGLAKKSPACVPPGQARKFVRTDDWDRDDHRWYDDHVRVIRVGDRIDDRWVTVADPWRYGLDPRYRYYRYRDQIVSVDPDTLRVLALIGLFQALLN